MNISEHLPTILSQLGDRVRENGEWLGLLGVLLTILFGVLGIWVSRKKGGPTPNTTVERDTTGPAMVGNQTIQGPVTIGYTPGGGRALTADRDKLTELKVRLGVTEQALRTFFAILEQEVPAEQWPVRLGEIAERHKQALERLAALETQDSAAQALIGKARTAIEAGDHGRAEELLDQAEARELAGIQAAQTAVEQRRLSAAAVRAEQAELSLIQLHYRQAAERFAAAAELVPASKPEQRLAYREQFADALDRQGDEKGDNAALNAAIRAYRDLLQEYPREQTPQDWARIQNNLGTALQTLGARESSIVRLEAAVAAYRAALQEWTRERVPLEWATTQNNLGIALWRLGERESGTARLEEAVTAYRAALQEYTRDRVPLQWAGTQNNLGNALAILGKRESGMVRLEAACRHIEDARQVYKDAGMEQYDENFRQRLAVIDRLIAERR